MKILAVLWVKRHDKTMENILVECRNIPIYMYCCLLQVINVDKQYLILSVSTEKKKKYLWECFLVSPRIKSAQKNTGLSHSTFMKDYSVNVCHNSWEYDVNLDSKVVASWWEQFWLMALILSELCGLLLYTVKLCK